MTKISPGPWSVGVHNKTIVIDQRNYLIAHPGVSITDQEELKANALLIAVAPELLISIKLLRDFILDEESILLSRRISITNAIDALIKKAERGAV